MFNFNFQANRLLEFALHLKKTIINLKIDALCLWNIALAGTTCGNLLSLIEDAYGYLESKESILRGKYLEMVECEFAENDPHAEPAAGLVSKEATDAEAAGEPIPPKKHRCMAQGPNKAKLVEATPCIPSTTIPLHRTGVAKSLIRERSGSDGQSVYRCKFESCAYTAAQYAQCCMHICRKHLGVCIKCHLCDR